MVITRRDRVSTVLTHDESLIDVFTELSPAFERLRIPAMRKVMSRLVTVEQAARMAGIDPDTLVARLNGDAAETPTPTPTHDKLAVAAVDDTAAAAAPPDSAKSPPALAAIPRERIVEVDVREDLRRGEEPFRRIMSARATVPAGGALVVRAIFEPVPLYAVMRKQGFAHHTERLADDDWRVWFHPPQPADGETPARNADAEAGRRTPDAAVADRTQAAAAANPADDADVEILDVRDLEPPEPMMRTLAALEHLPEGATLVQINQRVPQFLLPLLDERGFSYEVREQEPDLVRVFIRRTAADERP